MADKLNGYALTKSWFAYAFENPEAFNPTDHALYFWVIECANSNGWKHKFSFGAKSAMEVLGIGSYNTYKKSFDKLVEHGFIKVVRKSPNHYQAAIISVSQIDILSDTLRYIVSDTLTDVLSDELTAKVSDTNIKLETVNNKPKTVNIENTAKAETPINSVGLENEVSLKAKKEKAPPVSVAPPELIKLNDWLEINASSVLRMTEQLTLEQYQTLFSTYHQTEILAIFQSMHNYKPLIKNNKSVFLTARNWLERDKARQPSEKNNQPKSKVSQNVQNLLDYAKRNP